jgi:hypothetical protein
MKMNVWIPSARKGLQTDCTCMHDDIKGPFSEGHCQSAIDFGFLFVLLTKWEQQTMVKEWIKYAKTIAGAF